MQCWVCGAPANGVCRFCGRAVCRADAKKHAFVLEVYESGGTHFGLAVEDAIHCGVCKPRPDPVRMDFLDEAAAASSDGDEQHRQGVTAGTGNGRAAAQAGERSRPRRGKEVKRTS